MQEKSDNNVPYYLGYLYDVHSSVYVISNSKCHEQRYFWKPYYTAYSSRYEINNNNTTSSTYRGYAEKMYRGRHLMADMEIFKGTALNKFSECAKKPMRYYELCTLLCKTEIRTYGYITSSLYILTNKKIRLVLVFIP